MEDASEAPEYWKVGQEYEAFAEREGIPIHRGYYVQDVHTVEVDDWDRTGVRGALVNLVGHEGLNDIQITEIPPGEETKPQQHLHEQITYVIEGRGATTIGPEGRETTFEWDANALFAVPRNARYRHVNLGEEPVRLVTETDLPSLFTLFKDESFIFGGGHDFVDAADEQYYSTAGNMYEGTKFPVVWESNFVPDIHTFEKIRHWAERGAGGASIQFHHPDTSIWSHISQFPVGTYKKAHRHHPGANVIILEGEGYSMMWPQHDDSDKMRIDWQPGTILVPPALWFHQHFNTASRASRYLALHPSSLVFSGKDSVFDPVLTRNNIQYPDEDPSIRETFAAELTERDIPFRMPDAAYEDPDYSFEQNYEAMAAEAIGSDD
jgi:gentisate 1,2-dioxygenase